AGAAEEGGSEGGGGGGGAAAQRAGAHPLARQQAAHPRRGAALRRRPAGAGRAPAAARASTSAYASTRAENDRLPPRRDGGVSELRGEAAAVRDGRAGGERAGRVSKSESTMAVVVAGHAEENSQQEEYHAKRVVGKKELSETQCLLRIKPSQSPAKEHRNESQLLAATGLGCKCRQQQQAPGPDVSSYRLPDDEALRIFNDEILPAELPPLSADPSASSRAGDDARPLALLVVGQTGAGKTILAQALLEALERRRASASPQHPIQPPRTLSQTRTRRTTRSTRASCSPRRTSPPRPRGSDARRWLAMAAREVARRRLDVLLESACRHPDDFTQLAALFRDNDAAYRVEVVVLAVPAPLSRLGILMRFYEKLPEGQSRNLPVRLTPRKVHDDSYAGCSTPRPFSTARLEPFRLEQRQLTRCSLYVAGISSSRGRRGRASRRRCARRGAAPDAGRDEDGARRRAEAEHPRGGQGAARRGEGHAAASPQGSGRLCRPVPRPAAPEVCDGWWKRQRSERASAWKNVAALMSDHECHSGSVRDWFSHQAQAAAKENCHIS
ncbi:hypothetical protein ACCO45_011628, partial [Purpureocillium lilacinum]